MARRCGGHDIASPGAADARQREIADDPGDAAAYAPVEIRPALLLDGMGSMV
jgi:hypothetical protein